MQSDVIWEIMTLPWKPEKFRMIATKWEGRGSTEKSNTVSSKQGPVYMEPYKSS